MDRKIVDRKIVDRKIVDRKIGGRDNRRTFVFPQIFVPIAVMDYP